MALKKIFIQWYTRENQILMLFLQNSLLNRQGMTRKMSHHRIMQQMRSYLRNYRRASRTRGRSLNRNKWKMRSYLRNLWRLRCRGHRKTLKDLRNLWRLVHNQRNRRREILPSQLIKVRLLIQLEAQTKSILPLRPSAILQTQSKMSSKTRREILLRKFLPQTKFRFCLRKIREFLLRKILRLLLQTTSTSCPTTSSCLYRKINWVKEMEAQA